MSTLYILGNGFDLGLGLNTSYVDYLKSAEFNSLMRPNSSVRGLANWLKDEQTKDAWFDMEKSIGNYYNRNGFRINDLESTKIFPEFLRSVNDFVLRTAMESTISFEDNRTYALIEHFSDQLKNGNSFTIYTYNYTGKIVLDTLINKHLLDNPKIGVIELQYKIKIEHLHGSVTNNFKFDVPNITLGTNSSYIKNAKADFIKKVNQNPEVGMFNDSVFDRFDRFVIYGHSLGEMDAPDFEMLFEHLFKYNSKKLDIFTKLDNYERNNINSRFAALSKKSEDEIKNQVKKYVNRNIEDVLLEISSSNTNML